MTISKPKDCSSRENRDCGLKALIASYSCSVYLTFSFLNVLAVSCQRVVYTSKINTLATDVIAFPLLIEAMFKALICITKNIQLLFPEAKAHLQGLGNPDSFSHTLRLIPLWLSNHFVAVLPPGHCCIAKITMLTVACKRLFSLPLLFTDYVRTLDYVSKPCTISLILLLLFLIVCMYRTCRSTGILYWRWSNYARGGVHGCSAGWILSWSMPHSVSVASFCWNGWLGPYRRKASYALPRCHSTSKSKDVYVYTHVDNHILFFKLIVLTYV